MRNAKYYNRSKVLKTSLNRNVIRKQRILQVSDEHIDLEKNLMNQNQNNLQNEQHQNFSIENNGFGGQV